MTIEKLKPHIEHLKKTLEAIDTYKGKKLNRHAEAYGINVTTLSGNIKKADKIRKAYEALCVLTEDDIKRIHKMYLEAYSLLEIYGDLHDNGFFVQYGIGTYILTRDDKNKRDSFRNKIKKSGNAEKVRNNKKAEPQKAKSTNWDFTGQDVQEVHRGLWV